MSDVNFSFASTKEFNKINPRQVNIFNCWEEEVVISPGQLTETAGKYALLSLQAAVQALKNQQTMEMV